MSEFALGLIETRGKLAAIEAADVALKSANVALCDVENATGALITVKVIGDVGAVKAAIDAAKARASLFGEVIATRIIPRPALDTKRMAHMRLPKVSEVGPQHSEKKVTTQQKVSLTESESNGQPPSPIADEKKNDIDNVKNEQASAPIEKSNEHSISQKKVLITCNLCSDPACTRKKGEPSKLCIKYKKKGHK